MQLEGLQSLSENQVARLDAITARYPSKIQHSVSFSATCFDIILRVSELELDGEGWGSIAALIEGANRSETRISLQQTLAIVSSSDKKRFAISDDGLRIRAAQGHSIPEVAIRYGAQSAPEFLYHGTATHFLESILKDGLRRGQRHHVHLSQSPETAIAVGQRHGKPVVLMAVNRPTPSISA